MSSAKSDSHSIDLEEVARLVAALEADLAGVRSGSASVDALRAEVESLRATLAASTPVAADAAREPLSRMHGLLGTVEVDALRTAQYVAQVGRLLGLS